MNSSWISQSLFATLLLVPAWLAVPFFGRNFGIRPEVFIVWYFIGVVITTAAVGVPSVSALVSSWAVVAILAVGLLVGGVANVMLFRAIGAAPNPGLPLAISTMANVGVFAASAALAMALPKYFDQVKADFWPLVGVVLTTLGVALIVIRR